MKCTTCTNTDFKSIHGRVFCANCGVRAAQRLSSFSPTQASNQQPDKIGATQVLDLSASKPPEAPKPTTNNSQLLDLTKPTTPTNTTAATRSQTHAKSLHQKPRINETKQDTPSRTTSQQQQETPLPPLEVPSPPQPPVESMQQENTPEPTYMQPHQTYTLKEKELEDALADTEDDQPIPTHRPITKEKKRRSFGLGNLFASRVMRTATVALSMVLLTGYVTYLNYPSLTLRVAANRANIEAAMPGYVPNGYSFSGPIAHSPGQLVITFQDDEGNISLSQSETRWDSQSLLENKIRLSASTYDTYRENGLTIYTYDGRYAAWINSGILYEIESENEINPEEIVRMASSL